jgi:hypothetical protein
MAQGKGNSFITSLLQLIFNTTTITGLAQNAGSPLTNLYVSLHTANPGAGGNQTTNEAAYGGYARVAVVRTSGGWTVSGETVVPASQINFPTASGGSETETYWAIGTVPLASGAGVLLWFGQISPTIAVATGVTPELTVASTLTES